jgi:GT2 family glycosyltransferase
VTSPPAVSVVIASRHRPALLLRALAALRQQDHDRIEVIVVADLEAAARVQAGGLAVKCEPFDEANLARARNAGIARASAPVVAFLDDDAVPEPTWASRLAAPFADGRVTQAGGHVRGRNGISFQWRSMAVDAAGCDHPLNLPDTVTLHPGSARWAIKTQGTNCAFRRSALLAAGGFDPAFRYFLDDADLNLRLSATGGLTAVVPGAQVHHGFAASDRRRADRTPQSLRDIGRSTVIFLRRHSPDRVEPALADLRRAERRRLLVALQDGRLEPRDIIRLMDTLEEGIAEGRAQVPTPLRPLTSRGEAFLPLPGTGPRPGRVIAGPAWRARHLATRAAGTAAGGAMVTVLALGLLPLRHRLRFDPRGFWMQTGGLFAASDRGDSTLTLWRPAARVAHEADRLRPLRPVGPAGDPDRLSVQHPAHTGALIEPSGRIEAEMSYRWCNRLLDRGAAGAYESCRRVRSATG